MNLGKALLLTALAASVVLARPVAAAAAPARYYLALGDSIAFGIEPSRPPGAPASAFDTGYVDVVAARLRASEPALRVVDLACPGESTETFVAGGCPWRAAGKPLHHAYAGSQLDAALAFLRAHRGRVSPITLTLWGNDASAVGDACGGKLACVRAHAPRAIARFSSRLAAIMRRLYAAAPSAEIVLTGAWNVETGRLAATDPLLAGVDAALARVAASTGARFADTFPVFNPPGSRAAERARLCALTFACSDGDGHPTDAGYRAIAAVVLGALGEPRATAAGRRRA